MLLAGEDIPGDEGRAANDLLLEVLRGYPAQNLSRLIHSDDDTAVASGAFVVSELRERAAPILDEVDFLLGHPLRNARFDALDALDALDAALTAASPEHGATLARPSCWSTMLTGQSARKRSGFWQTPHQISSPLPLPISRIATSPTS
jgi:hypothetical protein